MLKNSVVLFCFILFGSYQVKAACAQLNLSTKQKNEIIDAVAGIFKFYITITVEEDGTVWTSFNTTPVTCKKVRTLNEPSKKRYQYGCEMPIEYKNPNSIVAPIALSFSSSKELTEQMISEGICAENYINNDQDQGTIVTCPYLKLGKYKLESQNFIEVCDHKYLSNGE